MTLVYLLQFGSFAIAHAFIIFGWYALLGVRVRKMASPVRLLLAMTLLWVQILSVVLVLGLMGSLTRFNVVFANLSVAAVVTAVALSAGGGAVPVRRMIASLGSTLARIRSEPAIAIALLAASLGFSWYVTLAIFFPPVGYDDFAYHLPGAAFALQNSSLAPVAVPPRLLAINSFTQVSEFLSIWCFSLLGSDSMIVLWQSGIYLYFVAACYVLCRACGCTRAGSLFGLSLGAVTPTLLAQTLTSYNDNCVAAFFAAALAFAVIAGRDPSRIHLLALALSSGALLTAKLTSPLLVAVALGVFIVQYVLQRFPVAGLIRSMAFVLLIASSLGGYWYLRNFLFYGNPLYPFQIHLAGLTLPGIAAPHTPALLNPELGQLPLLQRLWRLWLEQKSFHGSWFYGYDSDSAGFGPIWFVIGIPSIIGGALLSAGTRQWIALAVLSLTACAYLGFNGNMSVRYTLFILPIMILGVAIMVDRMRWRRNHGEKRSDAALARWSVLAVESLGAVLVVITVGLMAFAVKDPGVVYRQILTAAVPKGEVEAPVLAAFNSLRTNVPQDSVVVFDETVEFIYPLWRPDFANKVWFVSSDQPMDHWSSRASALKARYLFAKIAPTTPPDAQSPLAAWIALHPSGFRLVARVSSYGELYEIL